MKGFFFLLFFACYLGSWQLVEGDPAINSLSISDTTDMNPNGSSELSLLMREMYDHALAARKLTLEQKKNPVIPIGFKKIKTAIATDDETKNAYYDVFADIYSNALNTYSTSATADIKMNYNNLVNTCLACHSSHCPGPVPKIKKLLLP